ncbi:peptidase [Rhizobium lusitanum]|uniref:peptidase n=1 Tax=Rhizobium lusitanum TaxID=293958 RepID=UPI002573FB7B|nr:peptidase [Rhizobium lusitanum]
MPWANLPGMKPIDIFRTGNHTDSQGRPFSFTDDDLQAIATQYDTALHEAPIVVGHPKQDAPAYGWIKSVSFRDGHLVAEPQNVEPQFAELVKDRRFSKVSSSFYPPNHPNNPTPGKYYLKHVGFLGAAAPAVKGLKSIEFADDADVVQFDDAAIVRTAWVFDTIAGLFRTFRESIIADKGIEAADAVVPSWRIDTITEAAQLIRDPEPAAPFTTYTEKEDVMDAAKIAELERREREIAERETSFAEKARKNEETARAARTAEDEVFVNGVVSAGRLPVGLKPLVTAIFADLDNGVLSFSEDGESKSLSAREGFRQLLGKLPVPVATGEVAAGDGPDFSDPAHVKDAINTEIEAARGRGETISPAEAAMRLTKR